MSKLLEETLAQRASANVEQSTLLERACGQFVDSLLDDRPSADAAATILSIGVPTYSIRFHLLVAMKTRGMSEHLVDDVVADLCTLGVQVLSDLIHTLSSTSIVHRHFDMSALGEFNA